MEVTGAALHKSIMGDYIPVRRPMFSVKLLLLLASSFVFLGGHDRLELILLAVSVVLNAVLLRKRSLALGKFLLVSTGVLLLIWCLLVRPGGGPLTPASCLATLTSPELRHALVRLWGLFAVGQLFAGCTAQYELLVLLRRLRTNYAVSVFVILIGNAFAYFIQLYQQISEGFLMRCRVRGPVSRVFHVLTSLVLNALFLVSGCKKAHMLYENRIRNSILRTGSGQTAAGPCTLDFRFDHVTYPEQDRPVIRHAALRAVPGDVILLTGANGSGKTTLLNLISGIIPGIWNASLEGGVEGADRLEGRIGMVFQSVENQLFFDTAESQLCHLEPEARGHWLRRFGLCYDEIKNRSVMDFSSGEQQRLALVAELLDDTHAICLLDEPTAFLDARGMAVFSELLACVSARKVIVIVSHDPFCRTVANRFVTLRDGVLSPGCWDGDFAYQKIPAEPQETAYTVRIPRGGRDEELVLHKGELVGLVGPNGCGKTTMGRQLFHAISKAYPAAVCTMMMQQSDHQLFESTVMRELTLGLEKDGGARSRALSYLKRLGLDALCDQPAQFLSGGQKRTLVILCLLMQEPDVIILDEPLSSLDAGHAQAIVAVLADYCARAHPLVILCDQAHASLPKQCERIIHPTKETIA